MRKLIAMSMALALCMAAGAQTTPTGQDTAQARQKAIEQRTQRMAAHYGLSKKQTEKVRALNERYLCALPAPARRPAQFCNADVRRNRPMTAAPGRRNMQNCNTTAQGNCPMTAAPGSRNMQKCDSTAQGKCPMTAAPGRRSMQNGNPAAQGRRPMICLMPQRRQMAACCCCGACGGMQAKAGRHMAVGRGRQMMHHGKRAMPRYGKAPMRHTRQARPFMQRGNAGRPMAAAARPAYGVKAEQHQAYRAELEKILTKKQLEKDCKQTKAKGKKKGKAKKANRHRKHR